eukprot:10885092-Ditylum_brightwellii.AAC.1
MKKTKKKLKQGDTLKAPTLKTGTDHLLYQSWGLIDRNWVLLDSQSTANVFCNTKLLRNIYKVDRALDI